MREGERADKGEEKRWGGEEVDLGSLTLCKPLAFHTERCFMLSSKLGLKSSHLSSNPRWNTVRCTVIQGFRWKAVGEERPEWLIARPCLLQRPGRSRHKWTAPSASHPSWYYWGDPASVALNQQPQLITQFIHNSWGTFRKGKADARVYNAAAEESLEYCGPFFTCVYAKKSIYIAFLMWFSWATSLRLL